MSSSSTSRPRRPCRSAFVTVAPLLQPRQPFRSIDAIRPISVGPVLPWATRPLHERSSSSTIPPTSSAKKSPEQRKAHGYGFALFVEDLVNLRRIFENLLEGDPVQLGQEKASEDGDKGMNIVHRDANGTHESPDMYEPRSDTAKALASGFSMLRGSFTRALETALIQADNVVRLVTNAVKDTTTRILQPATTRQSPWNILASFSWQNESSRTPSSLQARRRERLVQVNRALAFNSGSKIVTSLTDSAIKATRAMVWTWRGVTKVGTLPAIQKRVRDVVVARGAGRGQLMSMQKVRMVERKALPQSESKRRSDVVKGAVGVALVTTTGAVIAGFPVGTVVSGWVLGIASVGVMRARAGTVETIAPVRSVELTKGQRRTMERKKKAKVRYEREWREKMRGLVEERVEDGRGRRQDGLVAETAVQTAVQTTAEKVEAVDTAAYGVGRSKPWVASMPVVGEIFRGMDVLVFWVERVVKRVMGRVGLRTEGGWKLLGSLKQEK